MRIRVPFVAGSFYPSSKEVLRQQVAAYLAKWEGAEAAGERGEAVTEALLVPHAAYSFSGPVAARGYAHLQGGREPEAIVLLGPDHRARGDRVSLPEAEVFASPLGDFPIELSLADQLLSLPSVSKCEEAHQFEHSLEVQLPFLHFLYGSLPILPLTFYDQSAETAVEIAEALVDIASRYAILVIATSDCSHYLADHRARALDRQALEVVVQLKEAVFAQMAEGALSFCGPGPLLALLHFAKRRGVRKGALLAYATSADAGGGQREVVGYASAAFDRPACGQDSLRGREERA